MKTRFPIPEQCTWGITQLAHDLRQLLTSPRLELAQLNALTGLVLGVSRLPVQTGGVHCCLEVPSTDDPLERRSFFIKITEQTFEFRVWHLETDLPEGRSLIEDFAFTVEIGGKKPTINSLQFDEWIGGFARAVAVFLYPHLLHPSQMPPQIAVSEANDQIDWSVYEKTSQNEPDLTDE